MFNFGRKKNADKGTKYGNKKVTALGRTWDSKKEYERYLVLQDAERRGIISELTLQPKFELVPSVWVDEVKQLKTKEKVVKKCVQLAINYLADFSYIKDGKLIVEDVKAGSIPKKVLLMEEGEAKEAALQECFVKNRKLLAKEYVLKKKLLLYLHHISVREIYDATERI